MNVEKKGCETNKVNADNAVERFEFLDAIFRIAVTKVSEEKRKRERDEEKNRRRGEERRGEEKKRGEESAKGRETKHTLLLGYDGACMCVWCDVRDRNRAFILPQLIHPFSFFILSLSSSFFLFLHPL